ncbi:MAG: TrkH family potassium uptake protein [Desulfobacteraceae bacterium]|jgi:trk system potassium uptake protein TrkH
MRWRYMVYVVGSLILFFGITMLLPLSFGIIYGDHSVRPVFYAMMTTVVSGLCLFLLFRKTRQEHISQREGMAIVAVGWTAIGFFGALPFYFCGGNWTLVDAFFESVSGFTTTGASILSDIEVLPKGLLLWRSFIQWLGGMGIIVLSIAILPFLGVGGMQLYKAEVPSPVPDKLKPRIRDTAMILWKVYAIFTAAEVILLMIGGMGVFDALCHAFTTLPTGGFSTQNASIAQFDNLYFDIVIIIFMVLAGINFSLHYQLMRGKPLVFWKDPECRCFLGAILVFTAVITWDCTGTVYDSIGQALRYGAFQVVSIITTTGYATFDYEQWPAMSQWVLLICMFLGASAGSTGGGVKWLRVMLCFKFCYKELFAMVHPRAVTTIKLGGQTVSEDVMRSVLGFLALFIGLSGISTVLLAAVGVDFVTALGAVAACIGNIGPGFGTVGPVENYAHIPYLGKWLLIWCMLLGRLEIYTMLILLVPEFWRK